MMTGEKPGGHGERCVAVGTLDMATWDAAAKIAGLPLHRFLAERTSEARTPVRDLPVYASGGYLYPHDDLSRLADDIRRLMDEGHTRFKIKIGSAPLGQDLKRIEAVLSLLPNSSHLAVDAMNAFDAEASLTAAQALAPYGLWWFEDVCDPLDFETQAAVTAAYGGAIAAGEALFSVAEAKLLNLHGGMRRDRDILLFDPVHCYGLPGYLQIVDHLETMGWPRSAFWPHGGHPFCLHVVAALGLGGAEINPLSFSPFGGLVEGSALAKGRVRLPDAPGIGFELSAALHDLFSALHAD
jgi:L-alanine-DL-glutamate epimerase-like enolase superfamily enzyme